MIILSLAVLEENIEVMIQPCHRRQRHLQHRAKTLTFSNITVSTGDIYLKLRQVIKYQKGNPYQ